MMPIDRRDIIADTAVGIATGMLAGTAVLVGAAVFVWKRWWL